MSSAIKTVELQTAGSGSTSPGGSTHGGGHEAGGTPMVKQGGVWAEICGDGVDINDATVICRTLGYGSYLHQNRRWVKDSSTPFHMLPHYNVSAATSPFVAMIVILFLI